MAIPVAREEVERVLRPWLGSLFLTTTALSSQLTERIKSYAPYRQTLEELCSELESFLVTSLTRMTRGSMLVLSDNYHSIHRGLKEIGWMTDDLMGLVFDKLTPFSANFIKLNDYSLRVESLSALRVLCQKYASFYTPEQLCFIKQMIRNVYPAENYRDWLKD
ncbi:MAG: hypothetical protein RSG96_07950 [Clostridia bacterium]